jgi:hypothetical protein
LAFTAFIKAAAIIVILFEGIAPPVINEVERQLSQWLQISVSSCLSKDDDLFVPAWRNSISWPIWFGIVLFDSALQKMIAF